MENREQKAQTYENGCYRSLSWKSPVNCVKVLPVRRTTPAILLLICCAILSAIAQAPSYVPKGGFVPDSATAVKIAEAVLVPVYGKEQVESERPFNAKLEHGVWTVSGTLHCPDGKGGITTNCVGGTAEVKLSKSDGRILNMIHYK